MARYLTPTRYRSLGFGPDLSAVSDGTLEALGVTASEMVNTECSVNPGFDFKGGTVTNEAHTWQLGNVYRPGSTRVWPYHRPIKTVSRLAIKVTDTQSVTMSGTALYVHPIEGYVEPISLAVTTAGIFGLSIIPNIGLKEPVAYVDYTYGWSFSVTDEPLTTYSGQSLQAQNQFWDATVSPEIKKNGVLDTSAAINYSEGTVTVSSFDSTALYSASYTYLLPTAISRATALILSDLIGYANINASGLSGLSGIRVEEIELRQSAKAGFISVPISPAAKALLNPYRQVSFAV